MNLRDRIAAVLTEHQREPDGNWGWKCQCGHGLYGETDAEIDEEMGDHQADAVIAELAAILKPRLNEYQEARRYDAKAGEADNSGNVKGDKLAKFVTDWESDDE